MMTAPSICCSHPIGLMALPTSCAAATLSTLTMPVSRSTSTSAAWVANFQKMLLIFSTPGDAFSRGDPSGVYWPSAKMAPPRPPYFFVIISLMANCWLPFFSTICPSIRSRRSTRVSRTSAASAIIFCRAFWPARRTALPM